MVRSGSPSRVVDAAAVERIGRRGRAERPLFVPGELCCDIERFSLQAKILIAATDREGLKRLCRYIARPPIKVEGLSPEEFLRAASEGSPSDAAPVSTRTDLNPSIRELAGRT